MYPTPRKTPHKKHRTHGEYFFDTVASSSTGFSADFIRGYREDVDTLFKPQKLIKHAMIKQDTVGVRTESGCRYHYRARKGRKVAKISPFCNFEYNVSDQSNQTTGGKQTPFLLGTDGSGTLGIPYSAGLYGSNDIGQMAKQAWSVLVDPTGGSTSSTTKGQKILIKKGSCEYYIQNNSTVEAVIKIYDIQARRDIQSVANEAYTDPITAWLKGASQSYQYSNLAEGSSDPTAYIDATPFQSRQFCQAYKVRKVTKINMSPGAVHTHRVIQVHDAWLDTSKYLNIDNAGAISSNIPYIGHLSTLTLVVYHGLPEQITATGKVTTGAVKLSVVSRTRYQYFVGASEVPINFMYSDLTNTAVGGMQGVAETSDAIVTDAQA